MRLTLGVLSLLLVLAIVAFLAKTQLKSAVSVSAAGGPAPVPAAGTPAQPSQQLQRQIRDDMARALQQGVDRAASAVP